MCRDDFHGRKIAGERIQMDGPSIVESNAAPSIRVGPEHGKTNMKHDRLATCLEDFPDGIVSFVGRIKCLIGRMKFEAFDERVIEESLGLLSNSGSIPRVRLNRSKDAGESCRIFFRKLESVLVGVT